MVVSIIALSNRRPRAQRRSMAMTFHPQVGSAQSYAQVLTRNAD
jgi:hypothetical protein